MDTNRDVLLRFFAAWIPSHMYKGRFSATRTKLPISDEDRKTIRKSYPHLGKLNVKDAIAELEAEYIKIIKHGCFSDQENWKTDDFTYTDQTVIKTSARCQVIRAVRNCTHTGEKTPCVIKCYYRIKRYDSWEDLEFSLHEQLSNKDCSVPKLYPSFSTDHYRCHPMENVHEILFSRIKSLQPDRMDMPSMLLMVDGIARVLHEIHLLSFKYIDISTTNVGFSKDGKPMLFDFGAVRKSYNGLPVQYYTLKYASQCAMRGDPVSIYNDYESLGYLLLDCCADGIQIQTLGMKEGFSLNGDSNERAKLFALCTTQNVSEFFKEYFTTVEELLCTGSTSNPDRAILDVIDRWKTVYHKD